MPIVSLPSLLILAASFAGWLLFALLNMRPSQERVSHYRQVRGRITQCWKDEMEDPDAEPPGDYWIHYEYDWEGDTMKGEDVADEEDDRSGFITGREVPVWVHSGKPGDSMLHDPGTPSSMSEVFSRPFFFLVIVTWLVLLAILTGLGVLGE